MTAVLVNRIRGIGIVFGVLLTATTYGQAPKPASMPTQPGVHRMEIRNGSNVTVRYFGKGLAPTEMAALRDLERAENEASFTDSLATLRQLYIRDETEMEARRHAVQTALYGTSNQTTFGSYLGGAVASPAPFLNNYAFGSNPFNATASPVFPGQVVFNPVYPNIYTPPDASSGGVTTTVTNSLAYGMGDEGRLKQEMAKAIAGSHTPESTAAVYRNLDNATLRVASLPHLREGSQVDTGKTVLVDYYGPITLTLKGDKEIKGTLVREDADWLVLQTDNEEVSIRKSEVIRTARPKK